MKSDDESTAKVEMPEHSRGHMTPRLSSPTPRRRMAPRVVALLSVIAFMVLALILFNWRAHNPSKPSGSEPSSDATLTRRQAPPVTGPSASSAHDFEAIFKETEAIRSQAFNQFRPNLLDNIYSPDCKRGCLIDREKQVIQELAKTQGKYEGFAPKILLVDIVSDNKAILEGDIRRTVTIRVVSEQARFSVVDPRGKVLEEGKGWPPESTIYDLHYSPSRARWVIWNQAFEGSGDRFLTTTPRPSDTPSVP